MKLQQKIQQRLEDALQPTTLELIDESQLHIGHAGAKAGGQHFAVTISSAKFSGLNKLACHRLIYKALHDLMPLPLHALRINIKD